MESPMISAMPEKITLGRLKECFSWYMYFCAFSAHLLATSCGMSLAWFSPVIPVLQSNNTEINPLGKPVTALQLSLLISLPVFFGGLSFLFWAKIIDRIGRKSTMSLVSVITMFSLVLMAFSRNVYSLLSFLTVNRICISGAMISVVVYNSEISKDTARGKLGCLLALQLPFGLLLGYIVGSVTNFKLFTLIIGLPYLLYLMLSPFIPESPSYLILKQRSTEAIRILQKLKGYKNNEMESENIQNLLQAATTSKQSDLFLILKNSSTRKALILGSKVIIYEQFSGISIILAYLGPIFNQAKAGLTGNEVAILVSLIKIVAYLISFYLVGKIGRRTLVLSSLFICMFPLFFLGVYFYLLYINCHLFDNFRWLAILSIIIYIFAYVIGLGVVPMTFVGEIFPDDLRAVGVACVLIVGVICCSIISFGFISIENYFGPHWCFWLFCIGCVIGFVNLYFTMPETKDKTFFEIQKMLNKL